MYRTIILALALAGCVISPTAVEVDDVAGPPPAYCEVRAWTHFEPNGVGWVLVTDSIHYVGCDGRVTVGVPE